MSHEEIEYPCKIGDVLYRIFDNCGNCNFETELCQRRICKHYKKYVEPMTVKEIDVKHGPKGPIFYVSGDEEDVDAMYGYTAFPTEAEAAAHLEDFN